MPPSVEDFVAALGKNIASKEVASLLKTLKWTKPVKVSDGGAYLTFSDDGIVFVFELPPDAKKKDPALLTLEEVQLYSKSPPNGIKKPFVGMLPNKLTLADRQTEVHAKLGKPDVAKKLFRLDTWKPKGKRTFKLAVNYKKAGDGEKQADMPIEMLHIGRE